LLLPPPSSGNDDEVDNNDNDRGWPRSRFASITISIQCDVLSSFFGGNEGSRPPHRFIANKRHYRCGKKCGGGERGLICTNKSELPPSGNDGEVDDDNDRGVAA